MINKEIETLCPVCSMNDISFVQPYKYRNPIFAGRSIVRCNHCSMRFVDPTPDETLLKEYNENYFDHAHGGMQTHSLTVAFHSAINLLRVLHVQAFQKRKAVFINSVLEIGPGGGHFARHWKQRNPDTNIYIGVESDKNCVQNLIHSGITTYPVMEEVPPNKQFDLVVISHVLEHTDNPALFIHHCVRQLRKGGVLFIEVPCNDYQHKASVEPHLLFFDKEPMDLFLKRMGFSHIQVSYHGNLMGSLQKQGSFFQKISARVKNFLLGKGVVFPFSRKETGLEEMDNALERAVIKSFKAHIEQPTASWWLRAVAIKN